MGQSDTVSELDWDCSVYIKDYAAVDASCVKIKNLQVTLQYS